MLEFWLDNHRSPYRKETQEHFGANEHMVWAKNADYMIACLKQGWVSLINFDYELGDLENGTGEDVALWIEEAAKNGLINKIEWKTHCLDIVGQAKIEAAMNRADFHWDNSRGVLS